LFQYWLSVITIAWKRMGVLIVTKQSKKSIDRFVIWAGCLMFLVSIVIYWIGMNFIREEVFPHYFNPKKHLIVSQNPDTREIYSWKDLSGKIYTPEDNHVKNFTWGTTILLLFVMIITVFAYNIVVGYYTRIVLQRETMPKHRYMPRVQ